MKARYIVEIDYPNSPFKKGEIIEDSGLCESFPDVFHKLDWHEYITKENASEFLMFVANKVNSLSDCAGIKIKVGVTKFWNGTEYSFDRNGHLLGYDAFAKRKPPSLGALAGG